MADVEQLVKMTLGEIERLLSTKAVVGEPIVVEGNTIIPLVSIGFGFGGGGGTGGARTGAKAAVPAPVAVAGSSRSASSWSMRKV